ncbi:MAG: hypothetical protein FH756_10955 [Firmicutes bacterium]|nr:hypothetical protein [Bacillota bacterium]
MINTSTFISMIFVLLAILVAVTTPIIIRKIENQGSQQKKQGKKIRTKISKKKTSTSLKDVWEVEDIQDGVISLTNNRYRVILRVHSVDFFLMSEPEQEAIENALFSTAMSINFPVQVFTTTKMIETSSAIQEIQESYQNDIPDSLKEYALKMMEYMDAMTLDRSMHIRSNYIIISYDTSEGFERARGELNRQASAIIDGLRKAKTTAEVLKTDAILDLLYQCNNRGYIFKPSEAVGAGTLDFIKGGVENPVA